jgi:hypothetical protein
LAKSAASCDQPSGTSSCLSKTCRESI